VNRRRFRSFMNHDPITVTVTYRTQPGQEALAHRELSELITLVQQHEPACLGITLLRHHDDPTQVLLVERWTSKAAYEGDHMQTEYLRAFIGRAPAFLAGPPAIAVWRTP
jgi:quinol monooxygenase YgiN